MNKITRFTFATLATGTLLFGTTACGTESQVKADPKTSVVKAQSALLNSKSLSLISTVDTTPEDLKKLVTLTNGEWGKDGEAVADLLANGKFSYAMVSAKPIKDSTSADLTTAMKIEYKDASAELRTFSTRELYGRADVKKFADATKLFTVEDLGLPEGADAPAWMTQALEGKWITMTLPAEAAAPLETVMDPVTYDKFLKVWEKNSTFAYKGEDKGVETVTVSTNIKNFVKDAEAAFPEEAEGASSTEDLKDLKDDASVVIDVSMKDDQIVGYSFDAAQLKSWPKADWKPQDFDWDKFRSLDYHLVGKIEVTTDVVIEKPKDATPIPEAEEMFSAGPLTQDSGVEG